MLKVGLLSDTHGFLDPDILRFFSGCGEIWHAGDIGGMAIADKLQSFSTLRAVFGNIDDQSVRSSFPRVLLFTVENLKVFLTHIGGYPGHYEKGIREQLGESKPGLFIAGHSHILKVMPDPKLGLLHINPGAAGRSGFHLVQTAVRFMVNGERITELDVYEKPRR